MEGALTSNEQHLIPIVIIGFVALLAGYAAAKRKGRNAGRWAVACGVLWPLLIILEFLPSKKPYGALDRKVYPSAFEIMVLCALGGIFFISGLGGNEGTSAPDNASSQAISGSGNKFPISQRDSSDQVSQTQARNPESIQNDSARGGGIFDNMPPDTQRRIMASLHFMNSAHQVDIIDLHQCARAVAIKNGVGPNFLEKNSSVVMGECRHERDLYMASCTGEFDRQLCSNSAGVVILYGILFDEPFLNYNHH